MGSSTSYEVQVMQGGKWRIHAQFPPSGRDDAIDEAKTLESMPGLAGVKVVRDNYDDRTGLHKEHVVYKHVPEKTVATSTTGSGASGDGGKYAHYMARAEANKTADIDFGDQLVNPPPRKTTRMGVFTKLMLVLLMSIAIAAVVVLVANNMLPYKKIAGVRLYGPTRSNIMIGITICTFLLSVLVSYFAFMRRDELDVPNLELQERLRKQLEARRKADAEKAEKKAVEEARQRQADEEAARAAKAAKDQADRDRAEKELAALAEKNAEKEEEPAQQEQEPEPEPEPEQKEEEYSNLSPVAEAQKAVLMGFFGEAVRALPPEMRKMDSYNRFGVNLFLAGAAESLGGARNLDGESIAEILASSLGIMGLKPEHAQAFAKRYEDYLLQDARYMAMFQSGRQTMGAFLDGDKDMPAKLTDFLNEWNKPKAPEDPEKEVVVMFTDIVGSTAMTHEKGNMAAQEVVRAHNRVVRDALSKTGGLEIKHTGDGIMASFQKVTDSLLATQQMQMMIEMHNQQIPDIPLKVKIGINAGRVVMEEKDLYGVTVQMAARIVDKAKADQIFVSDTVYGLAKGGSWRFVRRGPYYLKGIDGPAYLQELVWDDKVDTSIVEAAARAERPQLEQLYTAASGLPLPGGQAAPQAEAPAAAQAPAAAAQVAPAAVPAAVPVAAQPAQVPPQAT